MPRPEFGAVGFALVLLAALIAFLSAHTTLVLVGRAREARARHRLAWLGAAAVALGSGVWSACMLGTFAEPRSFPVGQHPVGALGSWGLAVGVSLAAMAFAGRRGSTALRVAIGGCALGIGMALAQTVTLLSFGLAPGLDWDPVILVLGALAAAGGCSLGLSLYCQPGLRADRKVRLWQTLPTLSLGGGAFLCQQLVSGAASLQSQASSAYAGAVPLQTLALLAAIGSIAGLVALQVAASIDARQSAAAREAKAELRNLSYIDPLTKLPNRLMFEGALAQSIKHADQSGRALALLTVGIDGFTAINAQFGHERGDRVLRETAKRLRALAGPHRVARLGGDEFLVLLADCAAQDIAARLAAQMLEALAQPLPIDGRDCSILSSIGIAMYPEHGGMSALITHAEAAMRSAKGTGGSTYCFFEARMLASPREQVELLRDLRVALERKQLEMYYQPKIHAPSGEITGAEALMRWHHPQRGMISPGVFIPIAERYGLIVALGNWVIDEACRQARAWRDEGLRMRVAINLSVHQLSQPDLATRIAAALERNRIEPKLITCEITESLAMGDAESTIKAFESLAAIGVHISIDDFGTGQSSLSQLRRLHPEELKIDRSFVLDLESSDEARAVVNAVVKLAQALGLKVVAEGVETEAQHEILRSLGCDELQGYLFARPMPARALAQWAISDVGPRSLEFRKSLFRATARAELA